jgi:hypothetical protein
VPPKRSPAAAAFIADHHLGQPDDGIERGAQLVAHAGDALAEASKQRSEALG